ncbi:MAG TPA: hypothetical protein VM890_15525 [Longimicrobium sp.]|jgi:hypothetical protein|nr:hypothetical protein [Longimicrobium sp.]
MRKRQHLEGWTGGVAHDASAGGRMCIVLIVAGIVGLKLASAPPAVP